MPPQSRNKKTHQKAIRRGLALYQTPGSPFWYARVWLPRQRRYFVRSTKEKTRIAAVEAAEEIYVELSTGNHLQGLPRDQTFEFFAEKLLANDEYESGVSLHPLTARNERSILYRKGDGVLAYMGRVDVNSIDTQKIRGYLKWVDEQREKPLSASTKSKHVNVIRKVLSFAFDAKAIRSLPRMPRMRRKDNPRSWFNDEEFENLWFTARESAEEGVIVRGVPITKELELFVRFLVYSFLRPTENEVFALRHKHVRPRSSPRSLQLYVDKPKTANANRWSDTTEFAPAVYDELRALNPGHHPSDYVFLPQYENRTTAKRIFQNQFNYILDRSGLKQADNRQRSLYSLRHTAITLRLIQSEGKVNLLNLARNARTSVAQIERFYAAQLPMTPEMVGNLQTLATTDLLPD